MLTARISEVSKITGLDAGADDYVTKPFSVLELTARIRANLRKKTTAVEKGELKINGLALNYLSRTVTSAGVEVSLTQKEFDLLKYLMLNAGAAVGREKLLSELWGFDYFGQSRTVDIHINNLRKKLGKEGDNIRSVRGVGYILKNGGK